VRDYDGMISLGDLLRGHAARLIVSAAERAPLDPTRLGIPRQPLDVTLRRTVLMRDGYRCCWCQTAGRSVLFEVDHIVPWSAGGSDHPVNLRTLCKDCNQTRSNRVSELDRRAFPIVWRCYSCDQWGDVEEQDALITAFCSTCRCLQLNVPYVADLMFGGQVPAIGIPDLQSDDVDYAAIPCTVRPVERRFRDLRAKDDARRDATARLAARAAARAELDRIRPSETEEQA
jgi:hypothetical protein